MVRKSYGEAVADKEPVLVELTVPTRQSPIDGLVVVPGTIPGKNVLDLSETDDRIADFLAMAAHSDEGFVARVDNEDRALAVVAATAAALCGADIRAALAEPDATFLAGLSAQALTAVRTVLLGIETAQPDNVDRHLRTVLTSSTEN